MGVLLLLKWMRRLIGSVILLTVTALAFASLWVVASGLHDDRAQTDAIVVLGAAQFDGVPSPVLRNRLQYALALRASGVAPRIVTVGGKRPGDRFTEAGAGRRYLRDKGVPAGSVTAIKTGADTYSSMEAVAAWARSAGVRSFTVVTDRCHEARASAMLRSLGFDVHGAAPASGPGSSITWSYVARETAGLLRFWFVSDRGPVA